MTLTLSHGPLAAKAPETVNYRIDGPAHRLLFDPFPRRVRALFGGETVLDTRRGMLLHESNILPQLYVPTDDMNTDLLEATDHHTHCPFKGDASYWTLRAGDAVRENAVWAYLEPNQDASWLKGYSAMYFDAPDAWFDEDEQVYGHLRDPYHRVDVRETSQLVRVLVGDEVIAETRHAGLLSETGLPNRYYVPLGDVRADVLRPSATHTHCPYKGEATYHDVELDGRRISDAAFSYPEPFVDALPVKGYLCFWGDEVVIEVDGQRA